MQKGNKDTPEGEDSESAKVLHFPSIAGQMVYKMSCPPDSFAPLWTPLIQTAKRGSPLLDIPVEGRNSGALTAGACHNPDFRCGLLLQSFYLCQQYPARWELAMPGRAAALPGLTLVEILTNRRLIHCSDDAPDILPENIISLAPTKNRR